ncbi:hypothetical protein BDV33DRAFT_196333 [Aspergillus novoparasiticus]|uniref:Uncharacterized protein n=1 Tax=Aspergillus novoparasiticus TaxID=986946 RepID=A0A5N6E9V1_9EURO|nr:hypothetical protein BDV33DRAFT_196333 [Aspergillus novoparasiticus]
MDETLSNSKAITVLVRMAEVTAEERSKAFPVADISHFVVQLSDKRLNSIIQSVVGIISKAFFDGEEQLEWLNAVRVQTREFIAFTNTQINRISNQETSNIEEAKLQIPGRGIIYQKVQDWLDYSSSKVAEGAL